MESARTRVPYEGVFRHRLAPGDFRSGGARDGQYGQAEIRSMADAYGAAGR